MLEGVAKVLRRYYTLDDAAQSINIETLELFRLILRDKVAIWVRAPKNIEIWLLDRENSGKLANEELRLHGLYSRIEEKRGKIQQLHEVVMLQLMQRDIRSVVENGSENIYKFESALDYNEIQYPEIRSKEKVKELLPVTFTEEISHIFLIDTDQWSDPLDTLERNIGKCAFSYEMSVKSEDLLLSKTSIQAIIEKYSIPNIDIEKFPSDLKNLIILAKRMSEKFGSDASNEPNTNKVKAWLSKESQNMHWKKREHKYSAIDLLLPKRQSGVNVPYEYFGADYLNSNIQGILQVYQEVWQSYLAMAGKDRSYPKSDEIQNRIRKKTANLSATLIKHCAAMIRPDEAPRGRPKKG
jgi:hypothetical protein